MKRRIWGLIFVILLCAGCSVRPESEQMGFVQTYSWMTDSSPIPSRRTGIDRQGIMTMQNGFECTDAGFYVMRDNWLLYCDHGSDTIIKLCARPDCSHNNAACNAYFDMGTNVCFSNGYLYVCSDSKLVRIDPDGNNRVTILDAQAATESGNVGMRAPQVWNGIFTIGLKSIGESGEEVLQQYFAPVDGSGKSMAETAVFLPKGNDGDTFIVAVGDTETEYYQWDPSTDQMIFLTKYLGDGYYGANEAFYISEGIIWRLEYAVGTPRVFLDTGLSGSHALHCFPDCFIVSNLPTDEQLQNGVCVDTQVLRFYNWDCEFIGELELTYPNATKPINPICGETAERILLTDSVSYIPKYYIEKSDLGTGNIAINEFALPESNDIFQDSFSTIG